MGELVNGKGSKGIPIGNLTSQHLANFYLAHLDHFVLQQLRPSAYVRYMDDFVLWGKSRQELSDAKARIESWLQETLQLELKSSVTDLAPCRQGLTFLGFRILPDRIRLAQRSLKRLRSRVRKVGKLWDEEQSSALEAAYAFARTAHSGGLRRRFGVFLATKGERRWKGSGSNRVNRGGSWNNDPANLRSANRNNNTPDNRNNNLGFRCVSP